MIFLGDIEHPFPEPPGWAKASRPWEEQPVIVNLEGPLNDDLAVLNTRRLFNHSSILSALEQYGVKVACLANNHIMDLPEQLSATIADLKSHGMDSVGAGANLEQAGQPALLEDAGRRVVILAFGWKTIQCQAAKHNRAGVNPLDPAHVLASIKKWRQREPQAAIVALMHWNYEMELPPPGAPAACFCGH